MAFRKRDKSDMFTKRDGVFFKVDDAQGIAYGWAIVSTINGEPYFDTQGDHIPMEAVIKAAESFMLKSRAGDEQHDERRAGDVPFALPVTVDIAKSLFGADVAQEGLVIGFKPYNKALLAKLKGGERRGFSIGGLLHDAEGVAKAFAKAVGDGAAKQKRVFKDFQIDFISAVDWPAQEGALVAIVKSAAGDAREHVLWMRKDIMPPQAKPQIGAAPAGNPMRGSPMGVSPMGMPAPPQQALGGGSMAIPPPKLTGDSDGHQHAISYDEVGEDGVGYTGFGIGSDGISHRHAFVVHPDGTTEIAINNGHTHTPDGTPLAQPGEEVPPDEAAEQEPKLPPQQEQQEEQAEEETAGEKKPAAPPFGQQNAAPKKPAPTDEGDKEQGKKPFPPRKRRDQVSGLAGNDAVASVTKEHAMEIEELKKQLAAVQKQLADAKAYGELTDAQKAHFAKCGERDKKNFLEMSARDRAAEVQKALDADEVLYKCLDGTEIRASQGEFVAKMAKRNDELAEKVEKEQAKSEKMLFEKRAVDELGHYPGTLSGKAALLKAVESIKDEKDKKTALAALKSGGQALAKSFIRAGRNIESGADEVYDEPADALDELAKRYAKEHKIPFAKAYDAVLQTEEGQALYAAQESGEYEDVDVDTDFEEVEGGAAQ